MSCLTGIVQFSLLVKSTLIGHRLENWFLNELDEWLARSMMKSQVYFWRLSTGVEVDFIVEQKPRVFPFEVTCNTSIDSEKVRNLKKFILDEPKATWGYYIYQGEFKIDHENKICFIPAWALG